MPRAAWNGAVLAESDRCIVVEGNRGTAVENGKDEGGQNGSNAADCPPRRDVARD
jgi:hypothetical protein